MTPQTYPLYLAEKEIDAPGRTIVVHHVVGWVGVENDDSWLPVVACADSAPMAHQLDVQEVELYVYAFGLTPEEAARQLR